MALTRKKQEALNAVAEAERRLCAHRGICALRRVYADPDRYTIKHLWRFVELLNKECEAPIQEATSKQLAFIAKLLDKNPSAKERIGSVVPNKWQASELINNLLTTEDMIVSPYPISASQFEQQEEELNEIIDNIINN